MKAQPRVKKASQETVERLRPYIDQILTVVKDMFNIECAWVSDKSCLSDFFDWKRDRSNDATLYAQIGEKLGIPLDQANDDDHSIVKIAYKLKQKQSA